MTLPDSEYDDIVAQLYAAGAGRIDWQHGFEPIVARLDLWGLHVIGLSKADRSVQFALEGGHVDPQAALDYLRSYHRINPHIGPTLTLACAAGDWLHGHRRFDDDFIARDPYFQEFLIPNGGRHVSGARLDSDAQRDVLLIATRGRDRPPLSDDEIALLDRLRRHLVEAVRIHLGLRGWLVDEGTVGRQVLDRMRQAMLLADDDLTIVYRNPSAQRLLEHGHAFSERNGRLVCRNRDDDHRLRAAIRALDLADPVARGHGIRRTVTRIVGSGFVHPTLVLAMALPPEPGGRAFGRAPRALLLLHATADRRPVDPLVIGEVFQLTPAEAQVATSLAGGESAQEIAIARGVALETVRAQIRAVYGKTGVRSRAELVALLLEMPTFDSIDDPGARADPTR